MKSPAQIMEQQMALSAPKKRTHAQQMQQAQVLLKEAIRQRDEARGHETWAIPIIRKVRRHWTFIFLPSWLKRSITSFIIDTNPPL